MGGRRTWLPALDRLSGRCRAEPRPRRLGILLLAYGSAATFALGYWMTPFPDYDRYLVPGVFHDILLRYAVISSLFLAGAVILAAGEFLRGPAPALGVLALLALWVGFAANFHQKWTWRNGGPAWHKSLDGTIAECRRDPAREWAEAPVWPKEVVVESTCRKFEQHVKITDAAPRSERQKALDRCPLRIGRGADRPVGEPDLQARAGADRGGAGERMTRPVRDQGEAALRHFLVRH